MKLSLQNLRSTADGQTRPRVVVVGHGMVGHRFCQRLLPDPGRGPFLVTVLGEEPQLAYDRIRLSESPSPRIDDLHLAGPGWYADREIDVRTDTRVAHIDPTGRSVRLSTGERLAYDVLVLATGSTPFVPPIDGLRGNPHVQVFRTYGDLLRLKARARRGTTAAVMGGGLLGLETAKVLVDAGVTAHVLEASAYLMPRQLDADSAAILEREVRALGVRLHLGTRTCAVETGPQGVRLVFDDGRPPLCVDMVVVAAGTTPRDDLARDAGLLVAARGGVIVDEQLRTSEPTIHAIGECVSFKGERIGLVSPGYEMADVLADNLRGGRRRFTHIDKSCHLKLLGVPVAAAGMYDVDTGLLGVDVPRGRRTLLLDGKRLLGVTCVGQWPSLARVQDAAMRQRRLTGRQIERFRTEGELWDVDHDDVRSWPEATVICNCLGVTRGQLSACVAGGCRDVAALGAATGAGTTCGSCVPLLARLSDSPGAMPPMPGRRVLLWSSFASGLLACAFFLLGPVPFAASVQLALRKVDALFRDDALKQASGYTVVGITALGALLSLRKRTAWLERGSFGAYRGWHALAGVLALVALLAHTGLRFGANLNLVLMTLFIAACALGALTGLAAAMESVPSGSAATRARRLRRPLTWVHLLLFWPLPLLLGLHVFSVYYF